MHRIPHYGLAALLFAGMLTMVGCSTSSGHMGHGVHTNVVLQEANYKVVQSVTGQASALNVLGIGMSREDLVGRAKRDMIEKAELHGHARALSYVTTDSDQKFYTPLVLVRKIYVSAEVIEFLPAPEANAQGKDRGEESREELSREAPGAMPDLSEESEHAF